MTANNRVGRYDNIVVNMAIMANMDAAHEIVAIADDAPVGSLDAAADIDSLLEHIAAANGKGLAFFRGVAQILRFASQYDTMKNMVVVTHTHRAEDADTAFDDAFGTNHSTGFNDRKGADRRGGMNLCPLFNNCCGMNLFHCKDVEGSRIASGAKFQTDEA